MAVTIRLARRGKKKQPHYFIVVQDKEKSPKGAFIEKLGYYNPRTNPITYQLDAERAYEWIKKGAKPSAAIERLLKVVNEGGPKEKLEKTKKFGKHREESTAESTPAAADKLAPESADTEPAEKPADEAPAEAEAKEPKEEPKAEE